MNRSVHLTECRAARLPRDRLAVLAPLRRASNVRVVESADVAWVTWDGDAPSILQTLLPVTGVTFYREHEGGWRALGSKLPDATVPFVGEALLLSRVVVPAPFSPSPPPDFAGKGVEVTLATSLRPRPTTAVRSSVGVLVQWAEDASTYEIERLSGAVCGDHAWLRGPSLPALPGSERYWGDRVLVPLGMAPSPDWPESALRQAASVDESEWLVLTPTGTEAVPVDAFRALTRAGVRSLAR